MEHIIHNVDHHHHEKFNRICDYRLVLLGIKIEALIQEGCIHLVKLKGKSFDYTIRAVIHFMGYSYCAFTYHLKVDCFTWSLYTKVLVPYFHAEDVRPPT